MPASLEEVAEALYEDTVYWARWCAKIVDRRAQLVPLIANSAQLKLDAALEQQRAAGLPMRAIILKARKRGMSTWMQAKIQHRITQRPNRRALVVGQDNDTAGELKDIGLRIYNHLPTSLGEHGINLKPTLRRNTTKLMHYGETSRLRQAEGAMGLDSRLDIDTAREVSAGRGYTYTDVHLTEVAFWDDPRKLTSILNSVPDEPETMVVIESTANGENHFQHRWELAESGESGYVPIFIPWIDDPAYALPFYDEAAREEFAASVGEGPLGETEQTLIDDHGCSLEQLHWRRKTIIDKTEGRVELFDQEYPITPDVAFMSSGKKVFSVVYTTRMRRAVEHTDPPMPTPDNPGPQLGAFEKGDVFTRKIRGGTLEVPRAAIWTPKRPGVALPNPWKIWEHPDPGGGEEDPERLPGAYVVAGDPAGGEENEQGELAYHALQVIDHRTKRQVASWRARIDPDLVTEEALLAALYFNRALIAIEVTGGYGGFMVRALHRDYGYPHLYRRRTLGSDREREEHTLGWGTGPGTKPQLEGHAAKLLRHAYGDEPTLAEAIVRCAITAREFRTFVSDERGRTGPQPNGFSDLLMAWMIAQFIAHEKPVPAERKKARTSTGGRKVRDRVTGW